MGGTSTDVSHFDGEYERAFETEVAGVRMRAPMMLIHTVAAGGGSILHFDGARFRVGPYSAGANPGPKCYRRNGPLAVTDANVMVGKLIPDFFPKIFGPAAKSAARRARRAATRSPNMAQQVGGRKAEEVADGFIKIAVENMANAIKKISVQRGYDVTRYALNCFGGAGGQHACLVADALGMTRVFIHPYLFTTVRIRHGARRHPGHPRTGDRVALRRQGFEGGRENGRSARQDHQSRSAGQGVPPSKSRSSSATHIRYAGTDTALVVASRKCGRDQARLRKGPQGPVRLHRPDEGDGGRSRLGRGGRRRHQIQRKGHETLARRPAQAGAAHAVFFRRRLA